MISFDFFAPPPPIRERLLAVSGYMSSILLATGICAFWQAVPKTTIDWIDVVGEGLVFIAGMTWLFALAESRPGGLVTRQILCGLGCFCLGFFLDCLDEFVQTGPLVWVGVLESISMPTGVLLLTTGLYGLRGEQLILNRQRSRRETDLRDHRQIDHVTELYGASYLAERLTESPRETQTLIIVDIDNFDAVNQRFGWRRGDALLNRLAAALVAGLPENCLVFHYAGDRFAILTPDRDLQVQNEISGLFKSVTRLFFRMAKEEPHLLSATSVTLSRRQGETAEAFLDRANRAMDEARGR